MMSDIPPWFVEGLAVYVSDGGGAGKVSEIEAANAILHSSNYATFCTFCQGKIWVVNCPYAAWY